MFSPWLPCALGAKAEHKAQSQDAYIFQWEWPAFLSCPELVNEGNRGLVLNTARSNYCLLYSHMYTMAEADLYEL